MNRHPEATPTPPNAEDLLAQQPPEVRAAIKQHEQDGSWQVFRTDQAHLYPYGERPDPAIDCEPLRSTDIQLQSGETITDVVMGDSERWQATPAASGDSQEPGSSCGDQAASARHQNQPCDLHHAPHLSRESAIEAGTRYRAG